MKKNNYYKSLVNKINKKTLKVSVIGLGYVGLPLSLFIAKKNFTVYGIDIDKKKILKTYKDDYLSNKININSCAKDFIKWDSLSHIKIMIEIEKNFFVLNF